MQESQGNKNNYSSFGWTMDWDDNSIFDDEPVKKGVDLDLNMAS